MTRKQRMIEAIKKMISYNPAAEHHCEYHGKGYRFDDINPETWTPRPNAQGVVKTFQNDEIFQIGELKIHF